MLSKTDLQSFAQCPLRLWLERHNPELISTDDTSLRRREMNGNLKENLSVGGAKMAEITRKRTGEFLRSCSKS
jgi:hypothetical protein